MKNYKVIHQFTPTVAYGDSVSNGLLFTQKILLALGFESNIYCCDKIIDIDFKNEIYHISQYKEDENHILFYHHSIGHICHDKIMSFADKKVLIYHNITPSHFFKDEKHLQIACDDGRVQLKDAVKNFIGSLGDSDYNCKELKSLNYPNPTSLALLLDLNKKSSVIANEDIVKKYSFSYNILFVGRVVQNKCQHQLIDVLQELKLLGESNIKLFIVGGVSQPHYFEFLHNYSTDLGLNTNIIITNKVSDEDLAAYYKSADLYLSLSEHEGFGMPFIEAMKYDIPILTYNAGGISSTVTALSLLEKKSPRYIAKEIIKLQNDPYFRVELLKAQKQHLKSFSYENMKRRLVEYLISIDVEILNNTRHSVLDTESTYQIEGPFDSSYSLAIVNKTIALALNDNTNSNVALYSTEGAGDFEPNKEYITLNNQSVILNNQSVILNSIQDLSNKKLDNIDITIRNLYPPRTNAMSGYQKIIGPYGWEESKFPSEYVEWFNKKTTMIFTMSKYVTNLLKDNGVYSPVKTIGLVVEDILKVEAKSFSFELPKNFKLLHISSAFPRKGLDKLLEAFNEIPNQEILSQAQNDEVLSHSKQEARHSKLDLESTYNISLIIKTFPNPHNKTIKQIQDLGFKVSKIYEKDVTLYTKDTKQILLINKDICQENIRYLYENSDLLVAPSFGEGFGFPMAEAMLLELPVLTTAYGGQTDFCMQENSWLLDFDFEYSHSHMNLNSSIWAVPKVQSIKDSIQKLYNLNLAKIKIKTTKAKEYIFKNYSSKQISLNIQEAIKNYPSKKELKKIALFSTYNTKCGIAMYSKYLISSFKEKPLILANFSNDKLLEQDSSNIIRCWSDGRDTKDISLLKEKLLSNNIDTLILQYNFSFLPLKLLEELLNFCFKNKINTHLFLHSSKDVVEETYTDSFSFITLALQKVTKIYMHTLSDMNYLKNFNIYKNTYLFTHGINMEILNQVQDDKDCYFEQQTHHWEQQTRHVEQQARHVEQETHHWEQQTRNVEQQTRHVEQETRHSVLDTESTNPTLASFGFLLPQKGILELVDIVKYLHSKGTNVKLLLLCSIHPAPISKQLEIELKQKILESGLNSYITLNTNFLSEEEIVNKLSLADKILFLYKDTQESSSAAVRMGLLSQKEVITSKLGIFDDVKSVVTQIQYNSIKEISETIRSLLEKNFDNTKQKQWCYDNSWQNISKKFYNSLL